MDWSSLDMLVCGQILRFERASRDRRQHLLYSRENWALSATAVAGLFHMHWGQYFVIAPRRYEPGDRHRPSYMLHICQGHALASPVIVPKNSLRS